MTWRLWSGDRHATDEIYLAPRHMAGDWKVSIHASGHRQSGPTKRLRDRLSPDDRRAESVWQSKEPWLAAILIHRDFLRPGSFRDDEVVVEVHDDEDAWLVIMSEQGMSEKGASADARPIGSVLRRALPPVHLDITPVPPIPELVDEILELVRSPRSTWKLPVDWAETPFGFGELQTEGPAPVFFEMAHDPEHDTWHQGWFDTFDGRVRPLAEAPVSAPPDVDPCGVILLQADSGASLFLAPHARCDHRSLAEYANFAIERFQTVGPEGWTPVDAADPAAGWVTLVATRSAIERSGREIPDY